MPRALYPTLETDAPGPASPSAPRLVVLAQRQEALDQAAAVLGVTPLSAFVSMSAAEIAAHPPGELDGMPDKPLAWSDPAEALASVDALISHVQGVAGAFPDGPAVLVELQSLRAFLAAAGSARFRLCLVV